MGWFRNIELPKFKRPQWGSSVLLFAFCAFFVVFSMVGVHQMASSLREKEKADVESWAATMRRMAQDVAVGDMPISMGIEIASMQRYIPFIITDEELRVVESHLIKDFELNHPDRLREHIRDFATQNRPIRFSFLNGGSSFILFYGGSTLLHRLYYLPYLFIIITLLLVWIGYMLVRSSRRMEQNNVWVGLAKETAHQLGTPISSLMGWVEYLRMEGVNPETTDEMERDLMQLTKVAERFSKIGSDTQLAPANINLIVESVVSYFRPRMPKGVELVYDSLITVPIDANVNTILIEWVIENLIKNALDAMSGKGRLEVKVSATELNVTVDVIDSGRGIPKGKYKSVFEPGYTTKMRGWGLGLSLSRRVVEEYHNGKIFVLESKIGVGTTMRIVLNRIYV